MELPVVYYVVAKCLVCNEPIIGFEVDEEVMKKGISQNERPVCEKCTETLLVAKEKRN